MKRHYQAQFCKRSLHKEFPYKHEIFGIILGHIVVLAVIVFSLFDKVPHPVINSPIYTIKCPLKKIDNNSQRALFSLVHTEIWLRYLFRKKEGVQNYFQAVGKCSQLGSSPRALSLPQKLQTSSLHQRERSFSAFRVQPGSANSISNAGKTF